MSWGFNKGVYFFYLQALSAKGWSPKGRRGKEQHFTCEATGGIRTWDFWSTVDFFNHYSVAPPTGSYYIQHKNEVVVKHTVCEN